MTESLTHYLAPEINVSRLDDMDVQPTLSEERQNPFIEDLNFELTWNRNY